MFLSGVAYQSLQTHISILIYRSRMVKKGLGWIFLRLLITILSAVSFTGGESCTGVCFTGNIAIFLNDAIVGNNI